MTRSTLSQTRDIKMKKVRIPKRVQRLVSLCEAGEVLCRSNAPKGGEPQYFLDPSNRNVGIETAKKAITLGLLVPNGDCLFRDGNDQTWSARHG